MIQRVKKKKNNNDDDDDVIITIDGVKAGLFQVCLSLFLLPDLFRVRR